MDEIPNVPIDLPPEESGDESAGNFLANKPYRFRAEVDYPGDDLSRGTTSLHKLTWLMTVMALLLAAAWIVPYFVEEFHYAKERGRQRAQAEMAPVSLKGLGLDQLSRAYQLVSQRVGPSVVHINIADATTSAETGGEFFGSPKGGFSGQGSGIIVDAAGYILTNRHVVYGAREIEVALSDGRHVKARTVGIDRPTDLALLKIDADKLMVAEWGNSEEIEVGALVWAVGSPFGFERSITFGILSAKHRAGKAGTLFQDLMQTDAAVNPGNSGGPLVDASGRVVGINTAIVGPSYQGISFAIPSSVARAVYERLKSTGHVARGWLGIEMEAVNDQRAKELGLTTPAGVLVKAHVHVVERRNRRNGNTESAVVAESGVREDDVLVQRSPAQQAGLQPGDIIQNWNGTKVAGLDELLRCVANTGIGKRTEVVIVRDGQCQTLFVEIGERPPMSE